MPKWGVFVHTSMYTWEKSYEDISSASCILMLRGRADLHFFLSLFRQSRDELDYIPETTSLYGLSSKVWSLCLILDFLCDNQLIFFYNTLSVWFNCLFAFRVPFCKLPTSVNLLPGSASRKVEGEIEFLPAHIACRLFGYGFNLFLFLT